MSETEIHTGKMKVFERNENESLPNYFKRYLEHKGIEYNKERFEACIVEDIEETCDNLRCFMDNYEGRRRKQLFVISYCDELIFDFVEHKYHEDMDIQTMTKNEDGTFDFISSFYNGGTCLAEMLSESYEKMKK